MHLLIAVIFYTRIEFWHRLRLQFLLSDTFKRWVCNREDYDISIVHFWRLLTICRGCPLAPLELRWFFRRWPARSFSCWCVCCLRQACPIGWRSIRSLLRGFKLLQNQILWTLVSLYTSSSDDCSLLNLFPQTRWRSTERRITAASFTVAGCQSVRSAPFLPLSSLKVADLWSSFYREGYHGVAEATLGGHALLGLHSGGCSGIGGDYYAINAGAGLKFSD